MKVYFKLKSALKAWRSLIITQITAVNSVSSSKSHENGPGLTNVSTMLSEQHFFRSHPEGPKIKKVLEFRF